MCLGIPAQLIEITNAARQMALAEVSGVRREVSVACVVDGPLEGLVGKWVLIHAGFAMAMIDEDEAAANLAALQALGETQEALDAMEQSARSLEGRA